MATYTSTQTSPTGVAQRVQELEAVLKYVLDKLKDLTAPENPDLAAVNAALDRLYKIVTFGSYTGSPSPRSETVFDQASNSLFYAIFGYNKDRVAAILNGGSTGTLSTMLAADTDTWFWSASTSLLSMTIGNNGNGDSASFGTVLKAYSNAQTSLASATFGSPAMLDAILGGDPFGNTSSDSLAFRVFGTPGNVPTGGNSIVSRIASLEARVSALGG
ncbi:hypothetical protein MOV66_10285 [Agrobacterium sp. SHOUNA12C]|nr:hypothetical protein [Agrobacterium sp. BETTINA12B]MCJ9757031.1 hypothetical protein [Agrobacterium sp. SHOUNA12C]